jgi:hypothetical protein
VTPAAEVTPADEFHPMTMPELRAWFRFLSARLRHVRIITGDWTRLCTMGAIRSLSVRVGGAAAGVFLDPPYSTAVRRTDLYENDVAGLSEAVREWCAANDQHPDVRIVLAGFAGEGHETLVARGWREVEWYSRGFLRGGMGNIGDGNQQHRERLWLSPSCLGARVDTQQQLFTEGDTP